MHTPIVLWIPAFSDPPACRKHTTSGSSLEHESEIEVIGLGTQDSLEEAREFVADRGRTFTMLWDESFES